MGSYKILKIYTRMINKTWKHNLGSTQSIKNVYNSYVIQEDFSYTFNNIDIWLHTRIEIGSMQRRINKRKPQLWQ